jgi:hypothetical protein
MLLLTETEIHLPTFEIIKFKFHTAIDLYGSFRLPAMFYNGVTFGITSQNPHNIQVSNEFSNTASNYYFNLLYESRSIAYIIQFTQFTRLRK